MFSFLQIVGLAVHSKCFRLPVFLVDISDTKVSAYCLRHLAITIFCVLALNTLFSSAKRVVLVSIVQTFVFVCRFVLGMLLCWLTTSIHHFRFCHLNGCTD